MSDLPPVIPALPNLHPWTLWAKWSSNERGTWHPLLFHLTDVAMCAEAMWDEVLSPAWKARLADKLGLSEDSARAWTVYLTGLHDLGKACPGFQLQLNLPHIEGRLRAAGLKTEPAEWVPHGTVSAFTLREYLPERFGVAPSVANAFAVAVGGHHGVFPTNGNINDLPDASLGGNSWRAARTRYADWFADLIAPPDATPPTACDHVAAVMFAGFVSVVDWIGSSETMFQHGVRTPDGEPDLDPPSYRNYARIQAHKALKILGWTGWSPSSTPASFTEMFPHFRPRPVQRAAIDLASLLDGPALVIIEEQMGEGKTETAAYLADTWTTRLGQNGTYFALPTQATTNQMFDRIRAFLGHRYPADVVNLQLLHGHAALSDVLKSLHNEARTRLLDITSVQDTDNNHPHEGGVIAAEWFAAGKRAILAPFGVGTVDQALLSALQVKHFFVRMYGLSSKTVIIDEVHAYDTYMSVLIERLLEWLGALRVPVILLSATLPSSRRKRLLDAYRTYLRSAGGTLADAPIQLHVPYPRISWATATSVGARSIAVDETRRRTLHLEWIDGRLPQHLPQQPGETITLGERLTTELAEGGCCVVICNTLRRAQAVYTALKPYFEGLASDGRPRLDLFHARYRQRDRAEREQRSLERFGKDGMRPDKAILVATQVVEQSLDLDFDVMVSDHAPADLLLQRSGRLHRHDRSDRPPRLREPRLLIVKPEAVQTGDVPAFDPGSVYVYEQHILLASWLALRERHLLRIPDDIEPLIEAVYETPSCPTDLSAELQHTWITSRAKMERDQAKDTIEAKNRYIKPPHPALNLADISAHPKAEESPELHPNLQALTRLTELTVSVVCLFGTETQPRLDSDGQLVSRVLTEKPDYAVMRALLNRSIALTDARVVHTLLKQDPPKGWAQSPLLCHRYLLFNDAATASVGRFSIHLDPELGVIIDGG